MWRIDKGKFTLALYFYYSQYRPQEYEKPKILILNATDRLTICLPIIASKGISIT
jgi:hypothetical protein